MTRYARALWVALGAASVVTLAAGLAGYVLDSWPLTVTANVAAGAVITVVALDIARGVAEARAARRERDR